MSLPAERSANSRADKEQPTIVNTAERKDDTDHINKGGQVCGVKLVGAMQLKELLHNSFLSLGVIIVYHICGKMQVVILHKKSYQKLCKLHIISKIWPRG